MTHPTDSVREAPGLTDELSKLSAKLLDDIKLAIGQLVMLENKDPKPAQWYGLVSMALYQAHEIGRRLGMDQANALWELAKNTQEIEQAPRVSAVQWQSLVDAATLAAEVASKRADRAEAELAALRAPGMQEANGLPFGDWVPMHERAPDPDTNCVVLLRYSMDRPPFLSIDRWKMQREDPIGMGGPTIETGYCWNDNDPNDVIAWASIRSTPPESWDPRLPDGGIGPTSSTGETT